MATTWTRPGAPGTEQPSSKGTERLQRIELAKLRECTHNPRQRFDEEALERLAASVAEHGVLTPLIVRPSKLREELFEIASGHRRYRAARKAGLESVPCLVRELTEEEFVEVLTVDNLQREDLDPLEEAEGYRQLLALPGRKVEQVAAAVSRSTKYVYDRVKLLELGDEARQLLIDGEITAGHAILLARLTHEDQERCISGVAGAARQGLFRHQEADHRGLSLFDDDLDEEDEDGAWPPRRARQAVTVRELAAWIDANVRFDRSKVDRMVHPETATTLFGPEPGENGAAEEEPALPEKVVPITWLHQVPPSARAEERTLTCASWKRADGGPVPYGYGKEGPSKTCDHAVTGVVVVGPERGVVMEVCTAKKKCRTHWQAEMREAKARAAGGAKGKAAADSYEAKHRAAREKRERDDAAWKAVRSKVDRAVRESIANAAVDCAGPLAKLLRPYGAKMPKGGGAAELVRFLALAQLERTLRSQSLPWDGALRSLKALGVDVRKMLRDQLKADAAAAKAKAPAKKKTAKKKTRRKATKARSARK